MTGSPRERGPGVHTVLFTGLMSMRNVFHRVKDDDQFYILHLHGKPGPKRKKKGCQQ